MAKRTNRGSSARTSNVEVTSDLGFGKLNAGFLLAGVVSIAVGYMLLAQGSITMAPLLLVLGYVVFMLLAILL